MYDKQVRRRRAVLAALVAASLILLTAYFGESAAGGLHSIQRGALQVLGPIQEGASRALKPFRDLFGWVGDTVDAKAERDRLEAERDRLEAEVARLQAADDENTKLREMLDINQAGGLERYQPVRARVTGRSPNLFHSAVTVDKGSSAGIEVDQPVVDGRGLVGRVTEVTRSYSIVTLITDEEFAVAARTLRSNEPGTVQAEVGGGGSLRLELVEQPDRVRRGDRVITAGSLRSDLESYYPPGITIGRVNRIEFGDGELDRVIHVRPAADLRGLLWVQVLTDLRPGELRADATP